MHNIPNLIPIILLSDSNTHAVITGCQCEKGAEGIKWSLKNLNIIIVGADA